MRFRPQTWLLLSLLFFLAGGYVWWLSDQYQAKKNAPPKIGPRSAPGEPPRSNATQSSPSSPLRLLSAPQLNPSRLNQAAAVRRPDHPLRLANTTKSVDELARSEKAILLENALIDTGQPVAFAIPERLRARGEHGSYIVQSRQRVDDAFRALLREAGAQIVSYIPQNAYLVRVSGAGAQRVAASPQTQTVLPYEPYYKLQSDLLKFAVANAPLPEDSALDLTLFADARASTIAALERLGATVVAEDRSPFGPIITVRPPSDGLSTLARLPGVQGLARFHSRVTANDLSRARLAVSADTTTTTNYLDLTGSNVLVSVNDSGVDETHPDLTNRVFSDLPAGLVDFNRHGTHVAGIIAGSGVMSDTVTNAQGSIVPGTNTQFRGKAPQAKLFSIAVDPGSSPFLPDTYLQETAARTNALISNNSWNYSPDNSYSIRTATYDAAVRDALPAIPGSQPLLYVFPVGNGGFGDKTGQGGEPGSIYSPATAKNVISVGAVEQPRSITNETILNCTNVLVCTTNGTVVDCTNVMVCTTNQPFLEDSDSDNQVSADSSRGNVGIGIEGKFGRFKPDVVAPGTFVISTRSSQWVERYNPTNQHSGSLLNLFVQPHSTFNNAIFVPENTVALTIRTLPNGNTDYPTNGLPIYLRQGAPPTNAPGGYDFTGRDEVATGIPANGGGDTWFYNVENDTGELVSFDLYAVLTTTNDNGNEFQVLSNLNSELGPYYRYESGSSMAAAAVSGTLALMQEFFEQRLGLTNSPALMKALLINGARSVGNLYDFQVQNLINFQGWGLVRLTTSLPPALAGATNQTSSSIYFFDQCPTNALATGQHHTRFVSLTNAAQLQPLRVTLVWTDPPGNPVTGIKLVNDLDLVVTNLDTGEYFLGNDILGGSDFNLPWNTNLPPNFDVVNNVENVYLAPPLGTNYAITVIGSRVNVNAVTASSNTAQDYALVISSGDGQVTNAFALTETPIVSADQPLVTVVTNSFTGAVGVAGSILFGQHVGANAPLLAATNGILNQWHFYVQTNDTASTNGEAFTNVAFITFLPPTLSIPRMGVREGDLNNATRVEADIDLYVSTDPGLTNLDPVAVAAADRSRGRGGTETIVYSNSTFGAVYYVGVKSEDQEAAEYSFVGVFSELPFSQRDVNGNLIVRGWPLPVVIPDGSPAAPGGVDVFALAIEPIKVRRVVVTDSVTHENFGDLLGNLSHGQNFVVLNNHNFGNGFLSQTHIYEDNGEGNVLGSQPTDGPGSLRNFIGQEGLGLWHLTMVDNAMVHTGRVDNLSLRLEPQQDELGGFTATIEPGRFVYTFVDVPAEATNLTVSVSGNTQPVELFLRRNDFPTLTDFDWTATILPPGGSLSLNRSDLPPLTAGRYFIGIFNPPGNSAQTVRVVTQLELDLAGVVPTAFASTGSAPILDDAVTTACTLITNRLRVASVDVGVRLDHPRESDLVLHLISPHGTRVLLCENRGGNDGGGFGTSITITNVSPLSTNGGPDAATNAIDTGVTSGTLNIDYDFFNVPDTLHVYYDGARIFDTGSVTNAGSFSINYGPGASTVVTLIVNEGGNTETNTVWQYTVSSVQTIHSYAVFTENTNLTQTPIKFAIPPFALTPLTNRLILSNSFDVAGLAGTYVSVTNFDGWDVDANQVAVTNDPPNAQTVPQYLLLGNGRISRPLSTTANRSYVLSFHYRSDGGGQGRVSVTPGPATVVTGTTNWQQATIAFTGQGSNSLLVVEGLVDGLTLDTFTVEELGFGSYYLPEESLNALVGENARGAWTLEIWDNRADAAIVAPRLLSWQLQFVFQSDVVAPPALVHGVTQTNTVSSNQITYFVVDVPIWASFATNSLLSATAPVNLLFNQTTPPTGTNPGDFTLLSATNNGSVTLDTTNSVPLLIPGQRYYLGVLNTNSTSVTFAIQVDFDITGLTNGVPFAGVLPAGGVPRYFAFDVSTNATAVSFELLNLSGNVSLIASRGAPLPTFNSYQYGSFNPGTNNESILVFSNSVPAPLSPGRWYLGVLNADLTNVDYTILATELTNAFPNIITLVNGVPYANTNAGGGNDIDYYRFVVATNAVRAQFEIIGPSGDVTLVARRGLPLPDLATYDLISTNGGTSDELIRLFDFSSPVPLMPGDWFISAANVSGGPVSYQIKATQYTVYGTNLVLIASFPAPDWFCVSWNSLIGLHYFVQGKPDLLTPGWTNVSPVITATGTETIYCIPLPSPYSFFRVIE